MIALQRSVASVLLLALLGAGVQVQTHLSGSAQSSKRSAKFQGQARRVFSAAATLRSAVAKKAKLMWPIFADRSPLDYMTTMHSLMDQDLEQVFLNPPRERVFDDSFFEGPVVPLVSRMANTFGDDAAFKNMATSSHATSYSSETHTGSDGTSRRKVTVCKDTDCSTDESAVKHYRDPRYSESDLMRDDGVRPWSLPHEESAGASERIDGKDFKSPGGVVVSGSIDDALKTIIEEMGQMQNIGDMPDFMDGLQQAFGAGGNGFKDIFGGFKDILGNGGNFKDIVDDSVDTSADEDLSSTIDRGEPAMEVGSDLESVLKGMFGDSGLNPFKGAFGDELGAGTGADDAFGSDSAGNGCNRESTETVLRGGKVHKKVTTCQQSKGHGCLCSASETTGELELPDGGNLPTVDDQSAPKHQPLFVPAEDDKKAIMPFRQLHNKTSEASPITEHTKAVVNHTMEAYRSLKAVKKAVLEALQKK